MNWNYISSTESRKYENSIDNKDILVSKENNHIYFYNEVNRKTSLDLVQQIRSLNNNLTNMKHAYDINDVNIYIHINSFGGDVFSAISVIDTILSSKIPVITIIEGCAASAATLISIVAKKRIITKNSYMLIHELKSSFWGKMSEIEDEFSNLQNLTNLIKNLYKKHTSLSLTGKDGINNILKHDLWWDANKCLKLGLVDEILE